MTITADINMDFCECTACSKSISADAGYFCVFKKLRMYICFHGEGYFSKKSTIYPSASINRSRPKEKPTAGVGFLANMPIKLSYLPPEPMDKLLGSLLGFNSKIASV